MADVPNSKGVSDAELEAVFQGPALASNRFFVTISPGGVRLAFMEEWKVGEPPMFRCAAMLSHQDAVLLKDLLVRQLRQIEEKSAAAKQEDGGKENG